MKILLRTNNPKYLFFITKICERKATGNFKVYCRDFAAVISR